LCSLRSAADPVKEGLVASLNRPGGNLTGMTMFNSLLKAKRLGLLRELVPSAATVAVLLNLQSGLAEAQLKDLRAAARPLGLLRCMSPELAVRPEGAASLPDRSICAGHPSTPTQAHSLEFTPASDPNLALRA
jgi:ABC transporter substrate binding protein